MVVEGSSRSNEDRVTLPPPILAVGVTGHRAAHASAEGRQDEICQAISELFRKLDAAKMEVLSKVQTQSLPALPTRILTMLGDGVDRWATRIALLRGWESVAPLPFGTATTCALGLSNAKNQEEVDERMVVASSALTSSATNPNPVSTDKGATEFAELSAQSRLFALSEHDEEIRALWAASVSPGANKQAVERFESATSSRYAVAARIVVEQSDFLVAVWDGASLHKAGGTGHTILQALDANVPVLWMNPSQPDVWRLLTSSEHLQRLDDADQCTDKGLVKLVDAALASPMNKVPEAQEGLERFLTERGRARSNPIWVAYRLAERLFGGGSHPVTGKRLEPTKLRVEFAPARESVRADWGGYFACLRKVWPNDKELVPLIEDELGVRFALADSIATDLSDAFRGAMTTNFVLAVAAVLIGLLYLPTTTPEYKWIYVLCELVIVVAIVTITLVGVARKWHGRWFDTRRAAEYLRHERVFAPLGVARPAGRWPQAVTTSWPEWIARQALRRVGLPVGSVGKAELAMLAREIVLSYVDAQLDYHQQKAVRLHSVHKKLDRLSIALFVLAALAGVAYLSVHWLLHDAFSDAHLASLSKWFTFFGVALPMSAATFSAVRYFGDFERFAGISDVARENLSRVSLRLRHLLEDETRLDYESVSRLAHAAEEVFIEELKSWQSIFGGKHMSVPA